MIGIIDYGMGNLLSVQKAFIAIGEEAVISREAKVLERADKLVLPGVGAFPDAMNSLTDCGLPPVIEQSIAAGKPFLGICLGMHLLFDSSEETEGDTPVVGLGLLPGKIVKIPAKAGYKVPQIGWNNIHMEKSCPLLAGIGEGSFVYFVHSYYLQAARREDVAATVNYSAVLDVAVQRDNICAVQFHPEKSGETGLAILKNFVNM